MENVTKPNPVAEREQSIISALSHVVIHTCRPEWAAHKRPRTTKDDVGVKRTPKTGPVFDRTARPDYAPAADAGIHLATLDRQASGVGFDSKGRWVVRVWFRLADGTNLPMEFVDSFRSKSNVLPPAADVHTWARLGVVALSPQSKRVDFCPEASRFVVEVADKSSSAHSGRGIVANAWLIPHAGIEGVEQAALDVVKRLAGRPDDEVDAGILAAVEAIRRPMQTRRDVETARTKLARLLAPDPRQNEIDRLRAVVAAGAAV